MRHDGDVRGNLLEAGRVVTHATWDDQTFPIPPFTTSPEILRLAVLRCVGFPLSLRNADGLLHERRIDVSHETNRSW